MDAELTARLAAGGVIGLGIDLVEVDRLRQALERHGERFVRRVFTDGEIAYCESLARPWPHYAARFAAKEAVSKCFGTGIGGEFGWKSVDVQRDEAGRPLAYLDARAQALLKVRGGREVLLSLTHTANFAQAIAVVVA
ncbi:MAG: holo-ACP synthase [Opitutales bacterium]